MQLAHDGLDVRHGVAALALAPSLGHAGGGRLRERGTGGKERERRKREREREEERTKRGKGCNSSSGGSLSEREGAGSLLGPSRAKGALRAEAGAAAEARHGGERSGEREKVQRDSDGIAETKAAVSVAAGLSAALR